MTRISPRTRRLTVLIGFFIAAFALYAAAESGQAALEVVFLGLMILLMLVAIITG
jgi:hypothetical protein